MSDVIDFQHAAKKVKKKAKQQLKKRITCREGHHKWQINQRKPFENKQGKLVTVKTCLYCDVTKTVLV